MKESEIRPRDLLDEQKKLYLEDVQLFVKNKDQFKISKCPVCSTGDGKKIFSKFGLTYEKCSNCRTVFLNPRPLLSHIKEYYTGSKNYKFWAEKIFPASEEVRRQKIFIPRLNNLIKVCTSLGKSRPKLLEVGAGFGLFSEEAQRSGFFESVEAVEPEPFLAQKCKQRGLKVHENFIEDLKLDHKVDVLVSFEVIEHLLDPSSFLKKCHDFLADDGLLLITCPNFEGFDVLLLGTISDQIDTEHVNMFNLHSVEQLLNSSGFTVLEKSTPGKLDVDIVHNKIESGEFSIKDNLFWEHIFKTCDEEIREKFQKFLVENNLSSNMQIIAKKSK